MKPIRSVERAIRILFLVTQSEKPTGLSEISRATEIDKATALRVLLTLEGLDLVQRDPVTRRYSPGPGLWRIPSQWRTDLRSVSRPYLSALQRKTGETVTLVCPRGLERVVVESFPASHELSIVPTIGTAHPIYAGASGILILAHMSDDERRRVIELTGLKPLTDEVRLDAEIFAEEIAKARKQGYACSIGTVTVGAGAVAAPVFDANEDLVAVVSLRAPEIRLKDGRVGELVPDVVDTAQEISRQLASDTALLRETA